METRLTIELCGRLADPLGPDVTVAIDAGGCLAGDLPKLVGTQHPALAPLLQDLRVRVCVDEAIVRPDTLVQPGALVALFPPVSGG